MLTGLKGTVSRKLTVLPLVSLQKIITCGPRARMLFQLPESRAETQHAIGGLQCLSTMF